MDQSKMKGAKSSQAIAASKPSKGVQSFLVQSPKKVRMTEEVLPMDPLLDVLEAGFDTQTSTTRTKI